MTKHEHRASLRRLRQIYHGESPVTRARRFLVLLALVAGTIGCDRVTKHLAVAELSGGPGHSYLADTVRLEYAENAGGFLSLGAGLPPWVRSGVFSVGTAILLVGVTLMMLRGRSSGPAFAGLCLIWAGGVSNLLDRVLQGTVVDFLNLGLGPVRTGIFNVADVAIVTGMALVLAGRSNPAAWVRVWRRRARERT